jgi:Fe-S-cluster-containing hydrogenase component 2
MLKALLIDPDKCTSCLQCEMACSFEHEGVFNPAKSRIKIFEFEHGRRAIPYTCTQCAEVCPTDAITYVNADWTGYARMQASAESGHGRPA